MRQVMIDWLIDVHQNFKLLPETLYIAVKLIDRYTELVQVPRSKYQLVGVTAMLIASKYEEIYPPYVKDFVYITDKAFTKEQVLEMEQSMLLNLDYNLTFPTPLRFLERYSRLAECDQELFFLSSYMMELSLVEVNMNQWSPSLLACAAIYVAKKIKEIPRPWNSFMAQQTLQNEKDVHKCAKELCYIINNAHTKRYYQAIFKKYSKYKYHEVAQLCKSLSETNTKSAQKKLNTQEEELSVLKQNSVTSSST